VIVTFHRAFDLTPDWRRGMYYLFLNAYMLIPETAFDDILSINGITRILTRFVPLSQVSMNQADRPSGHTKTALFGTSELSDLLTHANDPKHPRKIVIVPASGINASNVPHLREQVPGMEEVHLSSSRAAKGVSGAAVEKGVEMGFGGDEVWKMDGERLREFWQVIKRWG
jgi:copper homeostasis protein CutC